MLEKILHDSTAILPEIFLICLGLFVLIAQVFNEEKHEWLFPVNVLGLLFALFLIVPASKISGPIFWGMLSADYFSFFFKVLILIAAILILFLSSDFTRKLSHNHGEFYVLILFATAGMMFMASGTDFVSIYLGIELTSLSCYVLCGFVTRNTKCNESSLKYFILGLLASAILIFGISYIFGATGTTNLHLVKQHLSRRPDTWNVMLMVGMAMVFIGFCFKIAAAPFHLWAADVYEGAPTPVTAFLASAPKVAGFAALIRVFALGLHPLKAEWGFIFAIVAAISMTLGNLMALRQEKLKRMLAFSGVSHAGYALMGMVAGTISYDIGFTSVLLYMLLYFIPNIGAFAIIIMISGTNSDVSYCDLNGLGKKSPWLALVMSIFVLSLMGMPPASGFIGKFWVFSASVDAGIIWLAVIGVINAIIGSYYYLRVIINMYAIDSENESEFKLLPNVPALKAAVVIMAITTIYMGIFPNYFIILVERSVAAIV